MSDSSVRGRFVWHELMTTDTKTAADFYTKVVGWSTQSWDQDPSYVMLVANKQPVAGLMPLTEEHKATGAPLNWLSYIGTPDVDKTAFQAAVLGGRVLKQPADIPTIGRFAIIQDPQGAVFTAFAPLSTQPPRPDAAPAVGDFSWHELITTDWKAALDFYKRLFGWEETRSMDMGPADGTYQMYGVNGRELGGMFNKVGPPMWLPYIRVPDAKKVAAAAQQAGGTIINGPMEVPGGNVIAHGLDPQGVMFALHTLAAAAAASAKAPAAKRPVKTAGKTTAKKAAKTIRKAAKKAGRRTAKKSVARKAVSQKAVSRKAVSKRAKPTRTAAGPGRRASKSAPKKKRTAKKR